MMLASKTANEPAKMPRWLTWTAFVVSLGILGWLASIVFRKHH
jgi:hypothetical protein